ncbi:MAG: phosphate--acyl-ACP acyltransferase [Elusimicrobia bacterium CG08_land_8_20_14_0_20_51_18]|nr:MAG: phosphate--acyl-ACP acyltransferase [Elusimicrobia bacterium CG08_land_8_20_14_0_20_51_18]
MKIAIDAHGGDFGIKPNIEGALSCLKNLSHEIILVGRDNEIREELRKLNINELGPRLKIVNAVQIIGMDKEPVEECRSKPNSSLMIAAELVAEKKADAFVSSGNSGAIMVASLLKMKRIRGVLRPAIAIPYPTEKGFSLVLDAGANTDCKPWHLLQFALMGSVYMKNVAGIANPKVGILSIGEEECKGSALVQEAIPLLKKANINFTGPLEGRDIPFGQADVVVTDGFTGNVVLKLSEGLAKFLFKSIKDQIHRKFTYKIGAFLMKKIFTDLRNKTNPDEFGGAPLLGINGIAMVSHGKSNARAIYNAVRVAGELAMAGAVAKIKKEIEASNPVEEKEANDEKI